MSYKSPESYRVALKALNYCSENRPEGLEKSRNKVANQNINAKRQIVCYIINTKGQIGYYVIGIYVHQKKHYLVKIILWSI